MGKHEITKGEGRMRISLSAQGLGQDLIVSIYNKNAHIGAVAMSEYDHKADRTSTSVITRLGHKDDVIAQKAAYLISKHTKRPSCVIVGVHLDNITDKEIEKLLENADSLVKDYLRGWKADQR
ncbi:hypothetical protein ACFLXU_01035 [Chloroflexota bacterium]